MFDLHPIVADADGLGKLIFPLVVMIIYAGFSILGKVLQKGKNQAAGPRPARPQPGPRAANRPDQVEQFLRELMGEKPQAKPPPQPERDPFEVLARDRPGVPDHAQRAGRPGQAQRAPERIKPAVQAQRPNGLEPGRKPLAVGKDLTADLERRVHADVSQRLETDLLAADVPPPEQQLPDATLEAPSAVTLGAMRRTPRSGLAALLGSANVDLRSAIVITEVFGPPRSRRRPGPRR